MNQALLSSSMREWCTPKAFFKELDAEFNFTLDAAASMENALCANYFREDNRFMHPRSAFMNPWNPETGAVFCNPPYGRGVRSWVAKAYSEAKEHGKTIVMLIPARTDTSYFHDYIYHYAEIRFIRGRLRFTDSQGNEYGPAPFPSMVVIYNYSPSKAAANLGHYFAEGLAEGQR